MTAVEHRVRPPARFTRLAAVLVLAALVLYKGAVTAEPVEPPEPAATARAAGNAGGIFFPLRSVELKLWVDGKSGNVLPPPGGVLLTPALLEDTGKAVAEAVTFRLTSPTSPGQTPNLAWLTVDAKTGTLKVTNHRVLSDAGAQRRHVVWLDARVPSLPAAPLHRAARPYMVPADRARMNLTITLELVQEDRPCVNKPQGPAAAREDPCHYCHDACFWLAAELQVWENKDATKLAALGHRLADVPCGDKPTYTLKNGTEFFEVRDGDLWSKANLDRDAGASSNASAPGPGSLVHLDVECRAPWGASERRVVAVHVLDEDDNAPELQEQGKLEYNFTTEAQLARGAHLLVKDMDSRAANRFGELQVADPSGVVTHKKLEFDVNHVGVQHTLISIRLQVRDPMESHYNVSLTLTDATLRDGVAGKDLRMDVTMWGPPLTPPVAMSSSSTAPKTDAPQTAAKSAAAAPVRRRRAALSEEYADDASPAPIQLLSTATQFARLGQLGAWNDGKEYVMAKKKDNWGAVNVTREMGIMYVANASLIERGKDDHLRHVTVEVFSAGAAQPDRVLAFTIMVHTVPMPTPQCQHTANQSCAQHKTQKLCEKSCGLGSGSVGGNSSTCHWRDLSSTATNVVMMATKKYATCSSHVVTCPDTKCDPLERLDSRVCPQDCTDRVINGVYCETAKENGTNRGMCQCAGMGACDENGCQCHPHPLKADRGRRLKGSKRHNNATASPASTSPTGGNATSPRVESPKQQTCGSACQAAIMIGIVSAVLGVSLYACLLSCRTRRRSSAKRAAQTERPDEYQLRSAHTEVFRHDQAAANAALRQPRQPANVDPRWEVPRHHLILHEEIGAGEFGRVLRGTLTAEEKGPATVAVKTLRPSASGAELRDLLSELELLKDVEHPNVIRLLGACTDPEGPVCVLLEYCGLGSLRGYLHRSRWTDTDDAVPEDKQDNKDDRPSMTPRKIISFAWQIAKGMDYLGQLKLVHRDLASRNILLNENLVCKISDFGLSRDVYVDEAYCKLSAGKVPVKWMAPESLLLRVYTSKSDVWSFAVLLWELCTLGGAPYSGVAAHDMVALLAAGQRLARPEHCSRELYRVMQGCWQSEPQERPHFAQLVTILDAMLARGSGYLDLDARMVINPEYFEEHSPVVAACPPCAAGYLLPQTRDRSDVVRYENTAVT